MVLYATLILCALGAAAIVYRHDMFEREPWWMLLITATLGAGVMWIMPWIEDWSLSRIGGAVPSNLAFAFVASTHEELAKMLIVAAIAITAPKQFNDPMDGLVYGSIAGLGMAVEESIFYLRLDPPETWLLPGTEPVRLCGHLVMGGIGGFGIGMARAGRRGWPVVVTAGLGAATALHFAWDWIAASAADEGAMTPLQTAAGVGLMVSGLVMYGALATVASRWSRDVFEPGGIQSLWGWPFRRGPGPSG